MAFLGFFFITKLQKATTKRLAKLFYEKSPSFQTPRRGYTTVQMAGNLHESRSLTRALIDRLVHIPAEELAADEVQLPIETVFVWKRTQVSHHFFFWSCACFFC